MHLIKLQYILPELIGGLIGLAMWGRLAPAFRWLTGFLLASTVIVVLCFAWIDWYRTNFPPFHIYSNSTFLFYGMIFMQLSSYHRWLSAVGKVLLILLPLGIAYSLIFQHYTTFPSLHNNLRDVITVLGCMLMVQSFIESDHSKSLWKNELFWLVLTLLIYHTTTFFIWSYISTTQALQITEAPKLHEISNIMGVLYYSMLTFCVVVHLINRRSRVAH